MFCINVRITQTQRHRQRQTVKHIRTQSHNQTDAQAQAQPQVQRQRHTQTQAELHTQTHAQNIHREEEKGTKGQKYKTNINTEIQTLRDTCRYTYGQRQTR